MSTWDMVNESNDNKEEVNFLKIPVGKTTLRLIDAEPKVMWKHWIQVANGGKGMSVVCPGNGCPICAKIKSDKAKGVKTLGSTLTFSMNAITKDESGNIVNCVLEKGKKVFLPIKNIMEEMGDVINYEMTISRTGEKMQEVNYNVLPKFPPVALTSGELENAMNGKYNLDEVYKVYTNEELVKLMNGENIFEEQNVQEGIQDNTFGQNIFETE